ncbi:MAG: alginate lyase family protein [bacterium]
MHWYYRLIWIIFIFAIGAIFVANNGIAKNSVNTSSDYRNTSKSGEADSKSIILFTALNLDYPGLDQVKLAVSKQDYNLAAKQLARYFRVRKTPVWLVDGKINKSTTSDSTRINTKVADDALQHKFLISNFKIIADYQYGPKIDWTFNPTTQPDSKYARNNEWTFVLNRHYFWKSMGEAYHQTGDEKYAKEFNTQIIDWIDNNPVPVGKANQSPGSTWRTIEAGIRMSSTWPDAFYYFLASPNYTDTAIIKTISSIYDHAQYLMRYPTKNNWLTMEMNGLYHAGALFPEFKAAEQWRQFAGNRMRKELETQIYPDGAQIELTPGYHNVALTNFMGIVRVAMLNYYPLPDGYLDNIERMFDYDLWLMTPDRNLPPFNDSGMGNIKGIMKEAYRYFPRRSDYQWIATDGKQGSIPTRISCQFPYAGYYIMRNGWDTKARYLAFDAGPFGAAHQHEDKLNFILTAYGKPLVVEAGTYAYEDSPWRRYVLSPYAHNVIFVDGEGQNRRVQPETFLAKTPIMSNWIESADYIYAEGSYGSAIERYGETNISPAIVTRKILFVKAGPGKDFWVVLDTMKPNDELPHLYESIFHLDTQEALVSDSTAVITANPNGPNLGIFLKPNPAVQINIVKGQEKPIVQGWISDTKGFNGLRPIPTVSYSLHQSGLQYLLYVFYPVSDNQIPAVKITDLNIPGITAMDGVAAAINIGDNIKYKIFFPFDEKKEFFISGKNCKGKVYLNR